jgi:predicted porin
MMMKPLATCAALAIAPMSLLCISSSHAQSAPSAQPVVLYGRLNVDFESVRISSGTPSVSGLNRVSSNSSRLGVRGREDLGGGLFAIYQIESGVNPDAGSGALASRDSFVGLTGGFGTVRMGIMDTPFKESGGLTDRFKGTGLADEGAIAALGGSANGFSRRQGNALRYDTPNLSGFSAELQYGIVNETPAAGAKQDTTMTGAFRYRKNPLAVTLAFEQHRNFVQGRRDLAWRLGGKYDFGQFDVGVAYTHMKYSLAAGTVTRGGLSASAGFKLSAASFISARYFNAQEGKGSAPNGTTVLGDAGTLLYRGPDSGATQISFGLEHNLSKRTQLYAYFVRISNDSNANYRFGTNGLGIAQAGRGADPSAIVLGISHDF